MRRGIGLKACAMRGDFMRRSRHHVRQDGAVLDAVNVSVLRTDRRAFGGRLRALTAPARRAGLALT
jgi:hypothetical protein